MFIDELGHDSYGHGSGRGGENVFDLSVLQNRQSNSFGFSIKWCSRCRGQQLQQPRGQTHLQANDVLAVDLTDVVLSQ